VFAWDISNEHRAVTMKIKLILAASILLVSAQVGAAIITIGSLSTETDGSSEIINGSLNNREWLRWDILAKLNYAQTVAITTIEVAVSGSADSGFRRWARASWARLIHKVYEVDPLICPNCGSAVRPIAVIEEPVVIERIPRRMILYINSGDTKCLER